MKIVVAGASGLIGTALVPFLISQGHQVATLVCSKLPTTPQEILWNPSTGEIDSQALEGFDAFINLAGENIASGRWSAARKTRIHDSREQATRLLCDTIARLKQPPKVLINASAIGYYGDRGEESLIETSSSGTGFLAQVCRDWEASTERAQSHGVRVVCLRIGVVLTPKGGALRSMLLPFKLGLGGKIGSGKQIMSWVTLDDLVNIFAFALSHHALEGPVNVVAPNPVTNAEFTKALGSALKRPTWLPFPAFAARLILGEMADELLLSSAKVLPTKLQKAGYTWLYPKIQDALVL